MYRANIVAHLFRVAQCEPIEESPVYTYISMYISTHTHRHTHTHTHTQTDRQTHTHTHTHTHIHTHTRTHLHCPPAHARPQHLWPQGPQRPPPPPQSSTKCLRIKKNSTKNVKKDSTRWLRMEKTAHPSSPHTKRIKILKSQCPSTFPI
jgi:hypothetical protein